MSTPATQPAETRTAEPCAACGAPLAHDQRYCLHCGELRAGARRRMPSALRGSIHASRESVAAPAIEPAGLPSLAAALAGLACLLLAIGIGVLIGRGGGEPSAQAPITIAAATPATPAGATFTGDWPAGKDGWTIALAQLPKSTATPVAVADAKAAATAKGAPAVGALDSDAYPSLTAGSFVVYSGVLDDEKAATAARRRLLAAFPDARVVRVAASAARSPSGTAGKAQAPSSSSPKKGAAEDRGSSDTTNEFEKSKKAPKTVGTGGKPPAKDDKPAAGGGDFEEIG